ncbi:MAG TPA: sugar ABC transporter permease [Spirochaetales bacterium]|nr:sugar ABC transporter permease [Spirochaetales bacterium]
MQSSTSRFSSFQKQFSKNRFLFFMALSVLAWYAIFRYIPYYWNLIAFKDYQYSLGFAGSPWVGFDNFRALFRDPLFLRVFRNTLVISGLKIAIGFPFPIILAIFLNEVFSSTFKKTIQTITFVPFFISWVIYASILFSVLSPSVGMLNVLISRLGGEPIYFLASEKWFRPILVISDITKQSGYFTVIYMAALAGVDEEIFEAAICDGANLFQRIWHITIPGIAPVITILFILRLGQLLTVGFEQVYILYSPMVYDVGDVIETFNYRQGILGGRFSYTTALGLFKSSIGFVLVITSNWVLKKLTGHGLW